MLRRICLLVLLGGPCAAADWRPVTPEELQLASEPAAPRAPAIYLYREVNRNDAESYESTYARIKILTEEGRDRANVELEYVPHMETVGSIRARVIQPDGQVHDFDGTIYDKTLVRARGVKVQAKTFSLPDVRVGSIIEYRYQRSLSEYYVFDSSWTLADALFTREGHFTLEPNPNFSLTWSWPAGMPEGAVPPARVHGRIELTVHNVPAFIEEDYMPPEDSLRFRVEFDYRDEDDYASDAPRYWKNFAKDKYRKVNGFADASSLVRKAVEQVVQPGDGPMARARKLYARVQQFRNLAFERERSDQETRAEKLHDRSDAGDVLQYGYGDGEQLTWLYLALLRAAGLQADPVLLCTRDRRFLRPELMNHHHLNTNVVRLMVDGAPVYADPGSRFMPFGMLPWEETGVAGLRLGSDGGEWLKTPDPQAVQSHVERHADLTLDADGNLQGKLIVVYTGLEAVERRVAQRNADAVERRKSLEDEVRNSVPTGIEVKLANQPAWTDATDTLAAEFDLEVPGWAQRAAGRLLLPTGLFTAGNRHMFDHAERKYAIYFAYPYMVLDDIRVHLPEGYELRSPPADKRDDRGAMDYLLAADVAGGTLKLRHEVKIDATLVAIKYYELVRDFFQSMRTSDDTQLVLARKADAPAKPAGKS